MIQMVTDRTEADVILGNAKGVYNYTDLNRVESAVAELFELANELGLNFTSAVKTDWGIPGYFYQANWPTVSQMERYLSNVRDLADAFSVSRLSLPKTMSDLSYRGANAIEKCLENVYTAIQGTTENYRYSGDIYAGEEFCL